MTIDEIKELYKMIAERDDSIGDLISKIADKDARIAELEKDRDNEAENSRLMQDRLQRLIDGNLKLGKRIAELEEKNEWYHEEHAKELINRTELEKQVADLRCCGNCVHYAYDMEEDHHYCDKHIYSGLRHQGICTNNWQSDNKTKAEREK